MQRQLFLIAIIPNEKICREVKAFKLYAKENYGSGHALRSPAHITLQAPFRFFPADFQKLDSSLRDFVENQTSFFLSLNNFSAFPPRVIFVDVDNNTELVQLQRKLSEHLKVTLEFEQNRPNHLFHPHMTVSFKDLKRDQFDPAWQHFSNLQYQRFFQVKSIFLLNHENRKWHILKEYLLN